MNINAVGRVQQNILKTNWKTLLQFFSLLKSGLVHIVSNIYERYKCVGIIFDIAGIILHCYKPHAHKQEILKLHFCSHLYGDASLRYNYMYL